MDMFTHLSRFALSWAMAGMALFFVGVILWVFRPGSRKTYDNAASSIFRHDSRPADSGPPQPSATPQGVVHKTASRKSRGQKTGLPAKKPAAVKGA